MKTEILPAEDPKAIAAAIEALRAGEVVAFPTDTVYGLGTPAFDQAAIERLFAIKGRKPEKAIAVLIADPGDLARVAHFPSESAIRLAETFWPGALTLVVPAHPDLPEQLSPLPTIGLRVPDNETARALLRQAGPLATTSANRSGGKDTSSAEEVLEQLDGLIPLIIDGGRAKAGKASTVVDLTGEQPRLLRPGPVTLAQIEDALG